MPEPNLIYVSIGTMGTATGLMLGIQAAGLKSKIIAIDQGGKVLGKKVVTFVNVSKLFRETVELLRANDSSFPQVEIS
jgi:D-cysteine desulfhydrase